MRFKEENLSSELAACTPALHRLLQAADLFSLWNFGRDLVLTSVIRKDNPGSPHAHGRAADIRMAGELTVAQADALVNFLCSGFPYGDGIHQSARRETAGQVNPGTGSTATADHIHVQVRP